jgi:hypothetical protein
MTPREADRVIKAGVPVQVRTIWDAPGVTWTYTFTSRDRRTISSADGGKFYRDELILVTQDV